MSSNLKILLTGLPGCGKTTAVIKIVKKIKNIKAAGFYTQEIREENNRKGFKWSSLDGKSGILAHIEIKGRFRVGKYGVNVVDFEKSVVPILDVNRTDTELFVIDEIGKMECMSEKFIDALRQLFESDKNILATVAQKGSGLIAEVKNFPKVKLFTLTENNRDSIVGQIIELVSGEKKLL